MKFFVPTLNKDIRITFRYEDNYREIEAFVKEVDPTLSTTLSDGRVMDGYSSIYTGHVKLYYKDKNNKVVGRKAALQKALDNAQYDYKTRKFIWDTLRDKGMRFV